MTLDLQLFPSYSLYSDWLLRMFRVADEDMGNRTGLSECEMRKMMGHLRGSVS